MITDTKNAFGYVLELFKNNEDGRAVEEIKLHSQDVEAPGGRMWWERMGVLLEYGKRDYVVEHFTLVSRRVDEELAAAGTVNAEEYTS